MDTARREAFEEVGLELGPALGLRPRVWAPRPGGLRPMSITPVVFAAPDPAELRLEPSEVQEALWVPFAQLDPALRVWTWRRVGRVQLPVRVWHVDGHVVWGLTGQMLAELTRDPGVLRGGASGLKGAYRQP